MSLIMRRTLWWIDEDYVRHRKPLPTDPPSIEYMAKIHKRIGVLANRLDHGPFIVRVRLARVWAVGGTESVLDESGNPMERLDWWCRELARDVVANNELATPEAWELLTDEGGRHLHRFLGSLGEFDRESLFRARLEANIGSPTGDRNFAIYFHGVRQRDRVFVDQQLLEMEGNQSFPRSTLLAMIQMMGPTPEMRALLFRLIDNRSVRPAEVAAAFQYSAWLKDLPGSEVRSILEFILTGENLGGIAAYILQNHVRLVDGLPPELIEVAQEALQGNYEHDDMLEFAWGRLAIALANTDLERGFAILDRRIAQLTGTDAPDGQRPFTPFRPQGTYDLWTHLRDAAPERAYRKLFQLRPLLGRSDFSASLDLVKHRTDLLKVAADSEEMAAFLARFVAESLPGFFDFAFGLLDLFPASTTVQDQLVADATHRSPGSLENKVEFGHGLEVIRSRIADPATPVRFRPWLRKVQAGIIDAMAEQDRLLAGIEGLWPSTE